MKENNFKDWKGAMTKCFAYQLKDAIKTKLKADKQIAAYSKVLELLKSADKDTTVINTTIRKEFLKVVNRVIKEVHDNNIDKYK